MAYKATGLMAMYPVYLARHKDQTASDEEYDTSVAQNEVNLNQNLTNIAGKIEEIEAYLSGLNL